MVFELHLCVLPYTMVFAYFEFAESPQIYTALPFLRLFAEYWIPVMPFVSLHVLPLTLATEMLLAAA